MSTHSALLMGESDLETGLVRKIRRSCFSVAFAVVGLLTCDRGFAVGNEPDSPCRELLSTDLASLVHRRPEVVIKEDPLVDILGDLLRRISKEALSESTTGLSHDKIRRMAFPTDRDGSKYGQGILTLTVNLRSEVTGAMETISRDFDKFEKDSLEKMRKVIEDAQRAASSGSNQELDSLFKELLNRSELMEEVVIRTNKVSEVHHRVLSALLRQLNRYWNEGMRVNEIRGSFVISESQLESIKAAYLDLNDILKSTVFTKWESASNRHSNLRAHIWDLWEAYSVGRRSPMEAVAGLRDAIGAIGRP